MRTIGRSTIEKACPACNTTFTVTTKNRRKTYCSTKCSNGVITQGQKIIVDVERLREAIATTANYIEACEKLGISTWTFYRRAKELGVILHKKAYKRRSDGYWGYTSHINHRRLMEKHLGRKLDRKEGVHHLDGDKINNDLTNLTVAKSVRDHNAIHQSLQECGYELYKRGFIGFCRETNRYMLI